MVDEHEAVVEAVRTRVESGEYLDHMLGLPGVDTEGGGAFRHAPDGRLQRIHRRGDSGFRAARDAGRIPALPRLRPAPVEAVQACEAAIGRPLPALVRRCYSEFGDGGFGPGYGLLPLHQLADTYRRQSSWPDAWKPLAADLLPICHWGCGIASFIDLRGPADRMWAVDPNPDPAGDLSIALFPQEMTFASWLHRWVEERLFQPAILEDPDTGEWRPATDADWPLEA